MKRLKVAFEGILPGKGDVVVVQPKSLIRQDKAKELYDICKESFPDNKVVILLPESSIKTYDKDEFLKFLDSLRKMVEE